MPLFDLNIHVEYYRLLIDTLCLLKISTADYIRSINLYNLGVPIENLNMTNRLVSTITFLLIFATSYAADYYWVGGTGNWAELSNWATTSGGTVKHAQVPTSEDDIIFDGNSFTADGQTVTMNNEIMFFKSIDWTAISFNANFVGGRDVIMNCFGSLDLGNRVNLNFEGIVVFTGDQTGNIINYGNNITAREMYFAGGGDWTFQNNIEVDSIFQIERGNVSTDNHYLRCKYFYILTDGMKSLDLGSSTVEVWGHYGDRMYYHEEFDTITAKINTTNLNLNAGTSTINFTADITEVWTFGSGSVSLNDVNFTSNNGKNYLRPYYDVGTTNYNTLRLNGSSKIEGNHNCSNLILNRNKVYRFESGRNYNIDAIDAIGTCAQGIVITSMDAGVEATFVSSGNIDLDFVTLRDIHGSGGPFNATNSTDLGNNNNWTFTNSNTLDYYWVGGTGDWTDPAHWSLTSGGASSGCVPAGKDNAHFDANSFSGSGQEVTIDIEDIFIRDMMWEGVTGNPDLIGNEDYSMHITGSLRFDDNMDHTFGGYYYFESSMTGNTIETNGQQFNREVHFNGQDSDWTLLDDVYVHWNLSHHSGTLNTGGNKLDIYKYESYGSLRRHLDMTNSYIVLHDVLDMYGYPIWRPEWFVETENYSSNTDDSTIEYFTGHYGHFYHRGPNIIEYNNVVFSSYGGEVNGYHSINGNISATTIDSLIFRARGSFHNNQVINYLEFSPGYDYGFGSDHNYDITELNANGNCEDGHISIYSHTPGQTVNFNIDNDHTLSRLIVQDITNTGSGELVANISIDNGNNSGWTFDTITARVLYWVNNGGEWEDTNHWSLTSGGPGGECIPTSIDDVIFDDNSFDMENQGVYSDNNRFLLCHNMTWQNVFGEPNFGHHYIDSLMTNIWTNDIKIYGSLVYDPNMNVSLSGHHFATTEVDSVTSNGQEIGHIRMIGSGSLKFIDNVTNWSFDQINGSVDLSDITFNTNYFITHNYWDHVLTLDITGATIIVGRENAYETEFRIDASDLTFHSDSSIIYLTAFTNHFVNGQGNTFNRIIASNPEGITYIGNRRVEWNDYDSPIVNFQSIRFAGDGYILGQIETDTLIGSPGKTYTLEIDNSQRVNEYLQLIGNNCTPIQLQSNSAGTLADISMPSTGKVVVDFIEMRDNRASGGAEFIAGARSTDIAMSNVGWIFDDPPEYVETGFLGRDRALCQDSSLVLSAFNFSPSESYQWSDNTTDTTIMVTSTGTYNVTVTFDNGCMIEDEIIVLEPQDVEINLPPDTIICEGTTLTLNGSVGIQEVTYLWDDNSTRAMRDVSDAGIYSVSAEVDGCFVEDSVAIEVQEIPTIDLGSDQSFCEGQDFMLEVSYSGANYIWQDGSTDSTFMSNTPGIYWVESEINLCTYRDSIEINYVATPIADIGNDTTLCDGDVLTLVTPEVGGATISWQDGSLGNSYSVNTEGWYVVNVDITGCINSDSIYVTYQEIPIVDLGQNQVLCEGVPFTLDANSLTGTSYLWQDGSTDPVYSDNQGGLYWVETELNNCFYVDSIQVDYVATPPAEIGSDTTICEGEILSLTTQDVSGATISWQDGSVGNSYSVDTEGLYVVNVDITGCVNSDSIYVTYQEVPTMELGENQVLCEGTPFTLDGNSLSGSNYMWQDGSTNPTLDSNQDGIFWVEAQLNSCSYRDSIQIAYVAIPPAEIGNDTTLCVGQSLTLKPDDFAGAIYTWQDSSMENDYTVTNEGPYTVRVDNLGCIRTDSIYITFQDAPDFELGETIQACELDLVDVSTDVMADNYLWNTGDDSSAITVSSTGTYSLLIQVGECYLEDSIDVIFNPYPIIDLGPQDTAICDRETLTLDAGQEGIWQDGSSSSSFETQSEGLYRVTLSNNGCESSDSIQLTISTLR